MSVDISPNPPNSSIKWPEHLKANRNMSYEAIDLLYSESKHDVFEHNYAFITTCSSRSPIKKSDDIGGVVHKLEVKAMPNFAQANMAVTHEVCPGLEAASRIVTVNEQLKAIGFDSGAVVPVSNFGIKKTFNCDVRGRLEHHSGNISCLASNFAGTKLASGCTAGVITLYQARESELSFLSKTNQTRADHITHMSYLKPSPGFPFGSMNRSLPVDDSILLYSSSGGNLALVDTRCRLADQIYTELMLVTEPMMNITSFTTIDGDSRGQIVYLGGSHGEIVAYDLRQHRMCFYRQKLARDKCIGRMKEIVLQCGSQQKKFLAHTNGSDQLQILDLESMQPEAHWKCEREPGNIIQDFVQVEDKIVTCGDKTTIGCWTWQRPDIVAETKNDKDVY